MNLSKTSRWMLIALIALVMALALVGCGGREEAATPAPQQAPGNLLLPRISIRVNEQGVPGVLGGLVSTDLVARALGQDPASLRVSPETVQKLMNAGVQHIELVTVGEGLYPFVNGQPMPYLTMDEQTRGSASKLLQLAGADDRIASAVQSALTNPLLSRTGVPIVIHFPVKPGEAEIPVRERRDLPKVDVAQARAAVTEQSIVAHMDVAVDQAGDLMVAGAKMSELQQAAQEAGVPVDLSGVRMNPTTVEQLQARGVNLLQLETEPEGLYVYVNGTKLPQVTWDEQRLKNAVALLSQLEPDSDAVPFVNFFLPYIQPADVELSLGLPGSEQVQPSPFMQ